MPDAQAPSDMAAQAAAQAENTKARRAGRGAPGLREGEEARIARRIMRNLLNNDEGTTSDGRRHHGLVATSRRSIQTSACSRDAPHISAWGWRPEQHAGRNGEPNILHCKFSSSCTQRTPAGLPCGMPGIGLEMDGAIQHAPQPGRHACSDTGGEKPALTTAS